MLKFGSEVLVARQDSIGNLENNLGSPAAEILGILPSGTTGYNCSIAIMWMMSGHELGMEVGGNLLAPQVVGFGFLAHYQLAHQ